MFKSPTAIFAAIAGVALILVLLASPPLSDWNIAGSCVAGAKHTRLLGQVWCWLAGQKDSIGPLMQLLGVVGIVFVVLGFWRSQQLNQANAVFQMMKEARDLQLKLKPAKDEAKDEAQFLKMGVSFYSSIFQYRHLGFVDAVTWQPVDDELVELLKMPGFADWVHGRSNQLPLSPACSYDPNFIAHLKRVHSQRSTATAQTLRGS